MFQQHKRLLWMKILGYGFGYKRLITIRSYCWINIKSHHSVLVDKQISKHKCLKYCSNGQASSLKKLSLRRVQQIETIDVEMISDDESEFLPTHFNALNFGEKTILLIDAMRKCSKYSMFSLWSLVQTRRRFILPKCTPLKTTRMHQQDTPLEGNSQQPALMKVGFGFGDRCISNNPSI